MGRQAQIPPRETVERLRLLYQTKLAADIDAEHAADELALAILDAVEAGASRRQLALSLGVVEGTVRAWIVRARQVRASG